jgi:hypothetical protein
MAPWTRFDPTCIDLTHLDLRHAADLIGPARDRALTTLTGGVKDAAYVTVGLGLLGYQRTQVRRREFERALRRVRA